MLTVLTEKLVPLVVAIMNIMSLGHCAGDAGNLKSSDEQNLKHPKTLLMTWSPCNILWRLFKSVRQHINEEEKIIKFIQRIWTNAFVVVFGEIGMSVHYAVNC